MNVKRDMINWSTFSEFKLLFQLFLKLWLGYKMKSTLETERESLFETLTFCESAFVQSVAKEIRIDKLDAGFSG